MVWECVCVLSSVSDAGQAQHAGEVSCAPAGSARRAAAVGEGHPARGGHLLAAPVRNALARVDEPRRRRDAVATVGGLPTWPAGTAAAIAAASADAAAAAGLPREPVESYYYS